MKSRKDVGSLELFTTQPKDMLHMEKELWGLGFDLVAGVDEAGRGPLAGPVVAAAVIFSSESDVQGIDDSKKLTEEKREALFDQIVSEASYCAVALATPREIEADNILACSKTAMCRALDLLGVMPNYVLVDGNQKLPIALRQRAVVGGDGKSAAIAAASILAKVTRDRIMRAYHACWPEYGFDGHKGYPTAKHKSLVAQYGPCPIHRRTFSGVKEHLK